MRRHRQKHHHPLMCVADIQTSSIYSLLQTQLMETLSDSFCSRAVIGPRLWSQDESCRETLEQVFDRMNLVLSDTTPSHATTTGNTRVEWFDPWNTPELHAELGFFFCFFWDCAGVSGERRPQSGGWHGLFVRLWLRAARQRRLCAEQIHYG